MDIFELELNKKLNLNHRVWVYSNEVKHLNSPSLAKNTCQLVRVNHAGAQTWFGLYHKSSLMSARNLPFLAAKDSEITPENFKKGVKNRILFLQEKKSFLSFTAHEPYRLIHSDADGFPGITLDHYGSHWVIQSSSLFGDFLLPFVSQSLAEINDLPLYEKSSGQIRKMESLPERVGWISEKKRENPYVQVDFSGVKLSFNLDKCQKTGLFLDQRQNLRFLSELVSHTHQSFAGKSILDICSYVGAWSSVCAKNNFENFTLIDQDKTALKQAEDNINQNKTRTSVTINSLCGDMFEQLSALAKHQKKFSVVIADPPAFTKSSKHIPEAKRAYIRLIKMAAGLVEENGLLIVCSCSRHVENSVFMEYIQSGLEQSFQTHNGSWIVLHQGEQSPCHTRLVSKELGDYLKCFILQYRKDPLHVS